MRYTVPISRFFSGNVEESLRLRVLTLAAFWLVAIAVAWVGGSPWSWLGGGLAATCGHGFTWYRRRRGTGVWSVIIALMVVALALVMRNEILAVFDGNWLPLAHYLLLVQAIASFDVRTRGGLYAGLALSGIVLFFASQQAFEPSFGIFLLGYAVLLMAFLAAAFLEDESRAARPRTVGKGMYPLGFWSGIAVAVILLSVGAFLLLPRGESNVVGSQQLTALPITGGPEGRQPRPQVSNRPSTVPSPEIQAVGVSSFRDVQQQLGGDDVTLTPGVIERSSDGEGIFGDNSFPGLPASVAGDDVVMHVRSPVASYWRGQVFDTFDGASWRAEGGPSPGRCVGRVPGDAVRYIQTYYLDRAQTGATFAGYRGVKVLSAEEAHYRNSLGEGFSYKVVSVLPELTPSSLRRDRAAPAPDQYYHLPASMEWLRGMATPITEGADTEFDVGARIVEYLRLNGQHDASAPNQLASTASMDSLLLDGEPGTSLDLATANVMLARAAGLPARLATGYLPGERDLLSGAYRVLGEDAHAWSEVLFRKHGWVPFDSTHRGDAYAAGSVAGGQVAGLKYLFESSVGDEVVRAVVVAPSRLSAALKDAFDGPVATGMAAAVAGAVILGLVWLGIRALGGRRRRVDSGLSYTRLQGDGRDEMLRVFRRTERLLRKKGVETRKPGQTLGEYAQTAAQHARGVEPHLTWLTEAAWAAAYDGGGFPTQLVQEAKARLSALKAALG